MCSTPTYLFELKQKIQNWRTKPRCKGIKNGYQPHLIELPSEYLPDLTVFDWQQFMLTQGTLAPGKLRKEKKNKNYRYLSSLESAASEYMSLAISVKRRRVTDLVLIPVFHTWFFHRVKERSFPFGKDSISKSKLRCMLSTLKKCVRVCGAYANHTCVLHKCSWLSMNKMQLNHENSQIK